ncbi:hypothetical protein [Hyalangium rubrum]|uniref:Uncharacterized protein n=1 Tax=Hyalangium rubrum TaxID=3103134 RepID=A0ABU5HGY8_9BACT|nr:hypothetical protein [Hyalangium sp. s54d21]MDY7232139.1 hypothetical protein [Hyalangium sp. s54d21]
MASLLLFRGEKSLESLAFLNSRHARLWHVFVAFQPTLWMAALLGLMGDFRGNPSVWPSTRKERMAVVFYAGFLFAMAALPVWGQVIAGQPFIPSNAEELVEVPYVYIKLHLLNLVGSLVGVMLAGGMVGVHVQLIGCMPPNKPPAEVAEPDVQAEVQRFLRLRAQLKRFLGFAAASISSSLLSIGIFRNLINASAPAQPELMSTAVGMSFGIYFTGMLASLYLPAAKTLSDVGLALADRLVLQSLGPRATWKEWTDEQQAVRSYLGLQGSALQEIQQGVTLLAPLIAGVSTLVLGTAR